VKPPLLELRDARKDFRVGGGLGLLSETVTALDGVSLAIADDDPSIVALVGESGSGKSTICRLVMGLDTATSGQVLFRGEPVEQLLRRDAMRYRRDVQMVFQDPYSVYNPFYRVERVLFATVRKFGLASSRREAEELIERSMRRLGLRPEFILGRYPHQLSGGERQRLMLCRILLIRPKLIIADEPVSMLDASLRSILLDSLLKLRDELRCSCLYVTHDVNIAHYVSDRIVVMAHGSVMESGDARAVIRDPLHPYTQLLASSIPVPDPRKRWTDELSLDVASLGELKPKLGCKFSPRCPHVMDVCRREDPPSYRVPRAAAGRAEAREVACFLYADQDGRAPGGAVATTDGRAS
jgi:oligopeptide/dipeptide ABC transporter ATP-binding protein